jgi:hypothetical protein
MYTVTVSVMGSTQHIFAHVLSFPDACQYARILALHYLTLYDECTCIVTFAR